jgi:hypothetical protein
MKNAQLSMKRKMGVFSISTGDGGVGGDGVVFTVTLTTDFEAVPDIAPTVADGALTGQLSIFFVR